MSNYETKLWSIADTLRGNMDANEFKNYILGFIFYRYLSEREEQTIENSLLKNDRATGYDCENLNNLKEEIIEKLGYYIQPKYLFSNIIHQINNKENILEVLEDAFQEISDSSSNNKDQYDFHNLFEDVDLTSSKLGTSSDEKNKLISSVLLNINDLDFELEKDNADILGDSYEFLISNFASGAGKKSGEFYTPQEVSTILARIVTLDKAKVNSAYDPTCGSGSLLLRVNKEAEVSEFYGQELNITTYNLARMNMILHGIRQGQFILKQGDSLENDKFSDLKFEAIVANPPFSANWSSDKSFLDDERFSDYGKLAPKSKADYAFIQHMIYHLSDDGTLAVVLPHGVLFRSGAESTIRKHIVDDLNYLDAVIGLPKNIFYATTMATCILIFKKSRKHDDILFIDASEHYEKLKNINKLRFEDIEKIIQTYADRCEEDKYSHLATIEEIRENDYNLNIPRYVDTFEEEIIDLDDIISQLEMVENEINKVDAKIEEYCEKLDIKTPIIRKE